MLSQVWTNGWQVAMQAPGLKRWVVQHWYEFFAWLDRDGVVPIMNFGFADDLHLELLPQDEPYRYGIQMYHRVATQVDIRELDVLEVGSGRGGGASYLMRYLRPRTYAGLDIVHANVGFCQKHYRIPGLMFFQGDAEQIDFPDNTFDAVINIESSSHYGDIEKFLNEVRHVLRPGGFFLYADIWSPHEQAELVQKFERAGLTLVRVQNITPNVVTALERDNARKLKLIGRYVPQFLHGAVQEFVGTCGSENYRLFCSGASQYLCCLLQAPEQ